MNRALGVGISLGIVAAGLMGVLGYNFGTWLAIGVAIGVIGGAIAGKAAERRAGKPPVHPPLADGR